MATLREVQNAMKALVIAAIYPNGVTNPSITGTLVKVRVGWPLSVKLDEDVLIGNSQIRIFPIGMSDKNTTRFQRIENTVSLNAATLFTAVLTNKVTITGTVIVPQAIVINLNGESYGYSVLATDTLSTIATALAALVPGASALANVITITGPIFKLTAEVAVTGQMATEIKRQRKIFYVTIYAPTPDQRETLGNAVDVALSNVYRLNFPDTTQAVMIYKAMNEGDMFEKNIIYQRDLIYTVEYATMLYGNATVIEGIKVNLSN